MKHIAVIGTGISGMAVAYLLHQSGKRVTIYEKNASPGGHSRTIEVKEGEKNIPVDTGFIVFNHRNYPHLTALFKHLGVVTQKSSMTFGLTSDTGLEWGARNASSLFGQRRNLLRPAFYKMLWSVTRFNREALSYVTRNPHATVGHMLDALKLGKWFEQFYLLPMGSAIWSSTPEQMRDFPATSFVRFFENHGLLTVTHQPQWYTVTGGSREYIKKLTAEFTADMRLGCAAVRVERLKDAVEIYDTQGNTNSFDGVVFACHADETLGLIADATMQEKNVLGAFRYSANEVVVHSDDSFMPKERRCWSSWIYQHNTGENKPGVSVTYWMNELQSLPASGNIFVTLNPTRPVAESKLINRHIFHHPLFTKQAIEAQQHIPALQGQNRSWFCGAYQRYGFHEDGLLSAVQVATRLGCTIPW